jgi:hypothetical protein
MFYLSSRTSPPVGLSFGVEKKIYRRGTENAEKLIKNLCEFGLCGEIRLVG